MDTNHDQDMLYQIQILQAFGIDKCDKNDTDKIKIILDELYAEMKTDKSLAIILDKLSKVDTLKHIIDLVPENIDQTCFSLLFDYDYFDKFHNCILDFKHIGFIGENTLQTLLAQII